MRRVVAAVLLLFGVAVGPGCGDSTGPDDTADDSGTTTTDTEDTDVTLTCAELDKCTEEFCDQVLIPAGQFTMGGEHESHSGTTWPSGDERPVHVVELDAFCIDKYEVTLERYENCVQDGVCTPNGLEWDEPAARIDTIYNHYPRWCNTKPEECMDRAVNAKTWIQSGAFCEHMGQRLCTEAEWERAANGPGLTQRLHPWGDDPPTGEIVNIPSVGTGYVEPVDAYSGGQSVEGVFNMAGNVYEWVADAYAPYDVPEDGSVVVNPHNEVTSPSDDVVGRGSCAFTEPNHTVSERSVFEQKFDWG